MRNAIIATILFAGSIVATPCNGTSDCPDNGKWICCPAKDPNSYRTKIGGGCCLADTTCNY